MSNSSTEIKIAYIGGGSRHWARVMMQDLAMTAGMSGELALYDINQQRSQANAELGQHIFNHPDAVSHFKVTAPAERADALRGADFVFISILPGPMTCFANDLDIPLKYGIIQTVGDTIGPGGLSRNLRAVPTFVDIAHAVAQHCPNAWVINYTNPMTVLTQALTAVEPGLKTIGCCHEVFGTRGWIASMVADTIGSEKPLHRNDLDIEVVGLNHFTFFPWARYKGEDARPAIDAWIEKQGDFFGDKTQNSLDREAKGRFGSCDGLIQLDFLRRFNVIGAAGDRHLVEFVPWYCSSVETLRRWGVSVTSSAHRMRGWQPENVDYVPAQPERLSRSKEEGIDLVQALVGSGDMNTNVNVPNRGQIPWLPTGHVVETMANVRRDRVEPQVVGDFPLGLQVHLKRVADAQQLSLDAALNEDFDTALAALLADPLCQLDTNQAELLLRELLAANADHLPASWKQHH